MDLNQENKGACREVAVSFTAALVGQDWCYPVPIGKNVTSWDMGGAVGLSRTLQGHFPTICNPTGH